MHQLFNRYHLKLLDSIMEDEPYVPQQPSKIKDEIFNLPIQKNEQN